MKAYYFENSTFLMRASLLVREILLAFVAEVHNMLHPAIKIFGFDAKTYRFIKRAKAASMLKLAGSLVKASAITFTLNEKAFHRLFKHYKANDKDAPPAMHQLNPCDRVFAHQQVIRALVMLMADSVSLGNAHSSSIINFGAKTRQLLAKADTEQLEALALKMLDNRYIQFNLTPNKIKELTYLQMSYERREAIKNFLVIKKATYAMMSYLFSEENEDSVKRRRFQLGAPALKGRPKTAPLDDYVEYICLWTSNQSLTELDRFLLIHKALGYTFEILWTLYQRANAEGEFDTNIMTLLHEKRNNSAYQSTF